MRREPVPDGGKSRPDWRVPAIRCGLEVALVALISAYLWVNVHSALLSGVVAVLGLAGSVTVVFYSLNEQALAWVVYASSQSRRRRRRRQRQRREGQQAKRRREADRDEQRRRRRARHETRRDGE